MWGWGFQMNDKCKEGLKEYNDTKMLLLGVNLTNFNRNG